MLQYQIPESFLPGFHSLLSFSPTQIERLVQTISSMLPGTGLNKFSDELEKVFKDDEAGIAALAPMIFSLGSFKPKANQENYFDELSEGLSISFKSQFTEKKITDSQVKTLQKYLKRIFQTTGNFRTTFKAYKLLASSERVFREGHIITDIRLLFGDELKDQDRFGLVLHSLKIESEEDGQSVNYFYSMNKADLENLRIQVNRALEKEDLIKTDYKDITFIDITE